MGFGVYVGNEGAWLGPPREEVASLKPAGSESLRQNKCKRATLLLHVDIRQLNSMCFIEAPRALGSKGSRKGTRCVRRGQERSASALSMMLLTGQAFYGRAGFHRIRTAARALTRSCPDDPSNPYLKDARSKTIAYHARDVDTEALKQEVHVKRGFQKLSRNS